MADRGWYSVKFARSRAHLPHPSRCGRQAKIHQCRVTGTSTTRLISRKQRKLSEKRADKSYHNTKCFRPKTFTAKLSRSVADPKEYTKQPLGQSAKTQAVWYSRTVAKVLKDEGVPNNKPIRELFAVKPTRKTALQPPGTVKFFGQTRLSTHHAVLSEPAEAEEKLVPFASFGLYGRRLSGKFARTKRPPLRIKELPYTRRLPTPANSRSQPKLLTGDPDRFQRKLSLSQLDTITDSVGGPMPDFEQSLLSWEQQSALFRKPVEEPVIMQGRRKQLDSRLHYYWL